MFALQELSERTVRDLFATMALACVVTRAEDARLRAATWDELLADPWARYHGTGIQVVDTVA